VGDFAGQGGGGSEVVQNPLAFTLTDNFGKQLGGVAYYATLFDLNVDMVVRASATDSRTRVLASPIILTQDNKDATIEATTQRYFYKGKKYVGTEAGNPVYEDDVEQKSVGLTVKVTPRINTNNFVVMKVEESIENISGEQVVNSQPWPIVSSRKLGADIAVQSGQTIVLGGLIENSGKKSRGKIPVLGDIPFLGWFFSSRNRSDSRSEVLVFMTPYVLDTPSAATAEAQRRKDSVNAAGMWQRGWSNSQLAEPTAEERRAMAKSARQAASRTRERPAPVASNGAGSASSAAPAPPATVPGVIRPAPAAGPAAQPAPAAPAATNAAVQPAQAPPEDDAGN
jgi:general secretion pathway protein D